MGLEPGSSQQVASALTAMLLAHSAKYYKDIEIISALASVETMGAMPHLSFGVLV